MTANAKTFSTRALLTVATGLVIPGESFSTVHEAIEHLLGEPVWTHQLGSPEPWKRAREVLISQHPAFAQVDGDMLRIAVQAAETKEGRNAVAEAWVLGEIEALGGATEYTLQRGNGRSYEDAARDAVASLQQLAAEKGKPLLIVGTGS